MSARHTPGPWVVVEVAEDAPEALRACGLAVQWPEAGGEDVAYLSPCEDGEHRANARLVAAAPKLREVLVGLLEIVNKSVLSHPWEWKDHACPGCVGKDAMPVHGDPDFRCARHEAIALLAAVEVA